MSRKKPVKTFHPLAMAKSIEAQNEAVGLFIARVYSLASFADRTNDLAWLKSELAKIAADVETVRAILYPEDDQ